MSTPNEKRRLQDDDLPSSKKRKIDDVNDNKSVGLDEDDDVANNINTSNTEIVNRIMMSSEPITLNVGGVKYQTTLNTLLSYPDSVLYKMFEGKFSLKPNKDGAYFIDRNGKYFDIILDYLRNRKLILPHHDRQYVIECLLMESTYYQLESLTNELQFMSIDSNLLSVKQIKQIQAMVTKYSNKTVFKWELLYKYDISQQGQSIRPIASDIVDATNKRKSILMILLSEGKTRGAFLSNALKGKTCVKIANVSEGFGFDVSDMAKVYTLVAVEHSSSRYESYHEEFSITGNANDSFCLKARNGYNGRDCIASDVSSVEIFQL